MRPNGEALWSRQLRRHLKQLHGGQHHNDDLHNGDSPLHLLCMSGLGLRLVQLLHSIDM